MSGIDADGLAVLASPVDVPRMRYIVCDLLTDRVIAAPKLSGVTFGGRISRPADFEAELLCPDQATIDTARLLDEYAGRSIVYPYRNGQIWGGYIVRSCTPAQDQRSTLTFQMTGESIESYPFGRILREDLTFTDVDQGQIMTALWASLQAHPNGNIGVGYDNIIDTGVSRDRSYLATDVSFYGDLIQDLADVQDGAEFTIVVYTDDSGTRHKKLVVAPMLQAGAIPVATFTRALNADGGRLLSWDEPADATQGGTAFQARGATPTKGTDPQPLMSDIYYADALLAQGWPLWDITVDHTNTKSIDVLNGWAQSVRDRQSGAQRIASYTVSVVGTSWTPRTLGAPVRLMRTDRWMKTPSVAIVRPVAYTVHAADRSTPETVDLLFDTED